MAGQPSRKLDPKSIFRRFLLERGLKGSRQRDTIAAVFFAARGHLRVDELIARVRRLDARVSQATVYRTLKLLVLSGLAEPRHFQDGQTLYEQGEGTAGHHDHFICTSCGTIIEFVDEEIESLQERQAAARGFRITHHKMELYGLCKDCNAPRLR